MCALHLGRFGCQHGCLPDSYVFTFSSQKRTMYYRKNISKQIRRKVAQGIILKQIRAQGRARLRKVRKVAHGTQIQCASLTKPAQGYSRAAQGPCRVQTDRIPDSGKKDSTRTRSRQTRCTAGNKRPRGLNVCARSPRKECAS